MTPEERREKQRAGCRDYYQRHKDYFRKKNQVWTDANPEKRKEYKRRWDMSPRARHLRKQKDARRRYGLSREARLALFEASDGLCALCYDAPATVVDHDHETGAVRGALCSGCNTGLGRLGDSVNGLRQAIEYLETANAVL